jgi:hypothetical protein
MLKNEKEGILEAIKKSCVFVCSRREEAYKEDSATGTG